MSLHRTVGIEAGSGAGALRKSAGEACRFAGGQSKLGKWAGNAVRCNFSILLRACTNAGPESKSAGRAPANAGLFRFGLNLDIRKGKWEFLLFIFSINKKLAVVYAYVLLMFRKALVVGLT